LGDRNTQRGLTQKVDDNILVSGEKGGGGGGKVCRVSKMCRKEKRREKTRSENES